MHRAHLLHLLRQYQPQDSVDAPTRNCIKEFVASTPQCFSRAHEPGHITCSGWLVHPQGAAVLLTFHKKLNKWLQLGGHADGESNTQAAAMREIREESGITEIELVRESIFDLDVHEIPQLHEVSAHLHYDVRFLFRARSAQYQVSDESRELRWVTAAEITELTSEPSILRMVKKWRHRVDCTRSTEAHAATGSLLPR